VGESLWDRCSGPDWYRNHPKKCWHPICRSFERVREKMKTPLPCLMTSFSFPSPELPASSCHCQASALLPAAAEGPRTPPVTRTSYWETQFSRPLLSLVSETERVQSRNFTTVNCCNYSILFLVIMVNLLLCLIYKFDYFIGI
jgi:hypothetical protein